MPQDRTTPKPPPAPGGEDWTEEEKSRGAAEGVRPDAAGEPEAKGHPTDDRAATEGAAAAEVRDRDPGQA